MKYKKCKLGTITHITMGQSPRGTSYNNKKEGKAFLQGNKTFGRLYPTIDTWTTEPKKIAKKDSILMSVRAPVGDLNIANGEICIGRGLCSIEMNNGNNKYLLYLLKNSINEIKRKASGTVFDSINKTELEEIDIIDFSEEVQNKIIKILSRIDEKIELNNQTNDNLLNLVDTYFDEICIDTDYIKRADEIANITIGKTPPRAKAECFTKNDDDIKWLSISDIGRCGVYAFDTSEKLTEDAVNQYNVKIIPENTIVLSFKLTVGRVAITNEEMATNEAIAHFNLFDNRLRSYIYTYLRKFDYDKLGSTSSIATAVNSKIVKSMPIRIPKDENIEKFNKLADEILETIRINEKENKRLEQLRDTLLPKLMNGEIDLDKIEI